MCPKFPWKNKYERHPCVHHPRSRDDANTSAQSRLNRPSIFVLVCFGFFVFNNLPKSSLLQPFLSLSYFGLACSRRLDELTVLAKNEPFSPSSSPPLLLPPLLPPPSRRLAEAGSSPVGPPLAPCSPLSQRHLIRPDSVIHSSRKPWRTL